MRLTKGKKKDFRARAVRPPHRSSYTYHSVQSPPLFLVQIILDNKNSQKKKSAMIYYDSDRNVSKSL